MHSLSDQPVIVMTAGLLTKYELHPPNDRVYTGPKALVPKTFNALGCSPLFREAAAVGFRLNEHWSVMATVEHMSNAGLCGDNRGLTNFGGKLGYTF